LLIAGRAFAGAIQARVPNEKQGAAIELPNNHLHPRVDRQTETFFASIALKAGAAAAATIRSSPSAVHAQACFDEP
jgi:hypothetical protein